MNKQRGRPGISAEQIQAILTTYKQGEVGYKLTAKRLKLPLQTVIYYVRKHKGKA